jgi:hypothetical protein
VEKRNTHKILVGKPEGKKPLGRPRRRWVDNSKMDLREIGWGGMCWLFWFRIGTHESTVMNLRLPKIFGKFLSGCRTGGFSRRAQFHE